MKPRSKEELIALCSVGEATVEELDTLSQLVGKDPSAGRELREALAFSEEMRQALRDLSAEQESALVEAVDRGCLTEAEWIGRARDGDLSPTAGDELARHLIEDPGLAARLRAALCEEEWLSQAACPARSEEAFVSSLVTRMWAELQEDHFVRDFSRRLDEIDRPEGRRVVRFPGPTPAIRVAVVTGLAAMVAVLAFVATLWWDGAEKAAAMVEKATGDVIWAPDSLPRPDGTFRSGVYRLLAGAVSLSLSGGESLAVEGPAVFEVDDRGRAELHEGIALAMARPAGDSDETYGIGLTSRNVSFSDGAITVGLDARSAEATEAVIFSGDGGICIAEGRKCRDVFEREAVKADHLGERLVDVPYNPRAFAKAWELLCGVERNFGDVVIELPGAQPRSEPGKHRGIHVYVEKDRFRPEEPLVVDLLEPGRFATAESAASGESVAVADVMRSYLLQLWADAEGTGGKVEATVTFDHPVVGVIFRSERLWESDRIVGVSPDHLAAHHDRGLDGAGDQILLSEDGRTLSLRLEGEPSEIDQVRVLVALR